jgi:hypothetical protein
MKATAPTQNEPETPDNINLPNPMIAIAPLILVGV